MRFTQQILSVLTFGFIVFWSLSRSSALMDDKSSTSLVVGIALYADHATVTVRYQNGTFRDLGLVEGREEYIKLIEKWSVPSSQHISPPYGSFEEMWSDTPRQAWRSARKKLGLPASSDVGILSRLLKSIVELVGKSLELQDISVTISFPGLSGLYQEDIQDAASYVNLRLVSDASGYQPHEIVATYAGYGMGLRSSYDEASLCDEELEENPVRHTVVVEYTRVAILIHGRPMKNAVELPHIEAEVGASFELGSDKYPKETDLQEFVLEFLRKKYALYTPWGPPESMTAIITGSTESVADGRLYEPIKLSIEKFGSTVNVLSSNPDYVAARGAAEIAWRAMNSSKRSEL